MQQIKINNGDSLEEIQRTQMGNKVKAMDYKSLKKKKMKKKRELIVCSSYLNQKSSRGAYLFVNIGGDV